MTALLARTPRPVGLALVAAGAAALNLLVAYGLARGGTAAMGIVALAVLPVLLVAFGMLVESHRAMLAWTAFALPFVGLPIATQALPVPGGVRLFPMDLLLLLAVGAWLASRLTGREVLRLSPVFGWPLAILALAVLQGVITGNQEYGTSLVSQPFRLVAYAGIALALVDTTATDAWRAITRVFYAGAVVQAAYGLFYLATGGSQTTTDALSTGGTRYLSLSTALYLTGSLACALLNLERRRSAALRLLDLTVAGLASFGIVIAFGRAVWIAAFVVVALLLATRPRLRQGIVSVLPLIAPGIVAAVLILLLSAPQLVTTLDQRIFGTSGTEQNVRWREEAIASVLYETDDRRLLGVGFGRKTPFRFGGRGVIEGDPHNGYVWLLAGGGVVALGAWVLVGLTYLADALRRSRRSGADERTLLVWSLATWAVFTINVAAEPVLADPTRLMSMWILMALPALVALRPCSADVGDSAASTRL